MYDHTTVTHLIDKMGQLRFFLKGNKLACRLSPPPFLSPKDTQIFAIGHKYFERTDLYQNSHPTF